MATVVLCTSGLCNESRLLDVTESSGLEFQHQNGQIGEFWLAEILGSGVAVLDFNQDGLLDVWLVQSGSLSYREESVELRDRLFLNSSTKGQLRFEAIALELSPDASEYGMGIATGDIDADGDLDVFLANYGQNQLFENRGDGTFRDVTENSGLVGKAWSIAGSFFDYDSDGLLDLYVVNYVDFTLENHKECLGISNRADYCAPSAYTPVSDKLYKNEGAFKFRDVSGETNVSSEVGPGLGSISVDFNRDGAIDIYIANDPSRNFMWRNQDNKRFTEAAVSLGTALNADGKSEASMGLDAEDFDSDCDVDLFTTNLTVESNTLWVNSDRGWFVDQTSKLGLAASSVPFTGFGTGWVDFDLDGDLDLFAVNGAVSVLANVKYASPTNALAQRNQIWERVQNLKYAEILDDDFVKFTEVSRGAAIGDLDNDGDLDLIVSNNNGKAQVFQNRWGDSEHWIGFDVRENGTWASHAQVRLSDEHCVTRTVHTDGSYASASDPRLVFGLADSERDRNVVVRWADGSKSEFGPLSVNQYHIIQRRK